jgi:hypothetical protein
MSNLNGRYKQVRESVIGVVFLATPHRGADLTKLLSRVLKASYSRRLYVDIIKGDGTFIESIDRRFGDLYKGSALALASYFESEEMRLRWVFL